MLCSAFDYPVVDLWADFQSGGFVAHKISKRHGILGRQRRAAVAADPAVVADRRVTVRGDSERYH